MPKMTERPHFSSFLTLAPATKELLEFKSFLPIRKQDDFEEKLLAFVKRRQGSIPDTALTDAPAEKTLDEVRAKLLAKAQSQVADERWVPSATDIQRGRAQMLREFTAPQNLTIAQFATLAHKSRQQVYNDIGAGRLLVLSVGPRKQRIPDWQLDQNALRLTQEVMSRSANVDMWTLSRALSLPMARFGGRAPVQVVTWDQVKLIANIVLDTLGIQI